MMSPFKRTFLIQFETDFETDHFLQQAPDFVKKIRKSEAVLKFSELGCLSFWSFHCL